MLSLRVSLLEKICIMLRVVRTQLECCCCPVGDVLGILGSTPDLKELMFIPECIKLCDSEPFPQAWSDSLSARKNTVGLTSSHVSRLVSFGRSLGTTALDAGRDDYALITVLAGIAAVLIMLLPYLSQLLDAVNGMLGG